MNLDRRSLLGVAALAGATSVLPLTSSADAARANRDPLAPRPPMGWNSWNSFATTITEEQALEQAAIMQKSLLPAGYDIFTVDIQWYEPAASGYDYNGTPKPALDRFGRLLPALNRFPSSAGGRGFKPLADRIHGMGLKFGVHLMRGIPRLAVERDLPVLGATATARTIADMSSICSWNPDMYGVDMHKPGAQAYYDSVFALLASWDVDFVKVDDLSRPYDAHAPEIEGIALAIARAGRPMILSMSPGETPVVRGEHARKHAQMWRISDDFWDEWPMLEAQFTRLENWNPYMGNGCWPDANMLPLGRLKMGSRNTKFTADEQKTLVTLWSIARSPLIMGGDLRHLDGATLALLTNADVLAVNQASRDNRPHFVDDRARIWSARPENGTGLYVALFNPTDQARDVSIDLSILGLTASHAVRDLWSGQSLARASGTLSQRIPPHGAGLYLLQ